MSDLAIKRRLRRIRATITKRYTARGFEVFYDHGQPYRVLAVKRGQIKITDIPAELEKLQPHISVK